MNRCEPGRPFISVKNLQKPMTLAPLSNKWSNPDVVGMLLLSKTNSPPWNYPSCNRSTPAPRNERGTVRATVNGRKEEAFMNPPTPRPVCGYIVLS